MSGLFITFEGPEGGGKSTQVALLAEWLRDRGFCVKTTFEPGGTEGFGELVRNALLLGSELSARAELFLFLADRAHHVETVIRPALQQGHVVLCDRYADSTTVYQGIARGLGRDWAEKLNRFATGELEPDLTLLLDLPPEIGLARLKAPNRLDREPGEFHRMVREGFLQLAKEKPRFRVVDASLQIEEVAARIREHVGELLASSSYNNRSGPREVR